MSLDDCYTAISRMDRFYRGSDIATETAHAYEALRQISILDTPMISGEDLQKFGLWVADHINIDEVPENRSKHVSTGRRYMARHEDYASFGNNDPFLDDPAEVLRLQKLKLSICLRTMDLVENKNKLVPMLYWNVANSTLAKEHPEVVSRASMFNRWAVHLPRANDAQMTLGFMMADPADLAALSPSAKDAANIAVNILTFAYQRKAWNYGSMGDGSAFPSRMDFGVEAAEHKVGIHSGFIADAVASALAADFNFSGGRRSPGLSGKLLEYFARKHPEQTGHAIDMLMTNINEVANKQTEISTQLNNEIIPPPTVVSASTSIDFSSITGLFTQISRRVFGKSSNVVIPTNAHLEMAQHVDGIRVDIANERYLGLLDEALKGKGNSLTRYFKSDWIIKGLMTSPAMEEFMKDAKEPVRIASFNMDHEREAPNKPSAHERVQQIAKTAGATLRNLTPVSGG